MMSLQSSNQDSLLEDEKAKKEDRPSSSHFSTHSGTIQTNKEPCDDPSKPRKVHYHGKWEPRQDAVNWTNCARAQDTGLQFWPDLVPQLYIQLCASRLHLQSCTEDSTRECLAITAAATAAARHIAELCFGHQEIGAKKRPRYPNRQPRTTEHLETDAKC